MYLLFVFKAHTNNKTEWRSCHLFHFILQIHRLTQTYLKNRHKGCSPGLLDTGYLWQINPLGFRLHSKASFQAFLKGFSRKSSELGR